MTGQFFIDTRLPEAPEVKGYSVREFSDLIDRASRYNRTRAAQDAVPEELAHLFKFPAMQSRYKHHDRERLWRQFGGVCYLCREHVASDAFHVEHVVPLSRGGTDRWENLNVAHPACNIRKGSRLLEELDWVAG